MEEPHRSHERNASGPNQPPAEPILPKHSPHSVHPRFADLDRPEQFPYRCPNRRSLARCRFGALILIGLLGWSVGCTDHESIMVYQVPKETRAATGPRRMLAAMIRQNGKTWFFKLTGDAQQVNPVTSEFVELIRSVGFDPKSAEPVWKLPQGWHHGPGDAVRFATLHKKTAEGELEITITGLPTGPDWESYVLQNVNRWRRQLGLPPITVDQLSKKTTKMPLEIDPKRVAVMVDIQGTGGGGMSAGMPPFAAGVRRAKYMEGLARDGDRQTYVTRGVGHLVVPIRFLCPPEVTLITLV